MTNKLRRLRDWAFNALGAIFAAGIGGICYFVGSSIPGWALAAMVFWAAFAAWQIYGIGIGRK